jgi:hypothetical protein
MSTSAGTLPLAVSGTSAPSTGFIISDAKQELVGFKEVGLVEYLFQPDGFEVHHIGTPGRTDVTLSALLAKAP